MKTTLILLLICNVCIGQDTFSYDSGRVYYSDSMLVMDDGDNSATFYVGSTDSFTLEFLAFYSQSYDSVVVTNGEKYAVINGYKNGSIMKILKVPNPPIPLDYSIPFPDTILRGYYLYPTEQRPCCDPIVIGTYHKEKIKHKPKKKKKK